MDETLPETKPGESRTLSALQAVLGLVFVASGMAKLVGEAGQVQNFERWGYPQWFRVMTGGTETVGGAGLLAGMGSPLLTTLGGSLVAGTMIGAVYTHVVRANDSASAAAKPGLLLAIAVVVTGRGIPRLKKTRSDESGRESGDTRGRTDG